MGDIESTQHLQIELAGIVLDVTLHDSELAAAFAEPVSEETTAQSPALRVDVFAADESAACTSAGTGVAVEPLQGEGEYDGAFDVDAGRGWIRLTGRRPQEALANALRQLTIRLLLREAALVLHAACVATEGCALIFAGRSGAGKTTICGLCDDGLVLSDDLTVVRRRDGVFQAWGLARTVLEQREQSGMGPFPVRAVFSLVQDTDSFVTRVTAARALPCMLALPAETLAAPGLERHLDLMAELVRSVPCYELHFLPDASAWACVREALQD